MLGNRRVAPAVGDPLHEADIAQGGEASIRGGTGPPPGRIALLGTVLGPFKFGSGMKVELGGGRRAIDRDAQSPPPRRVEQETMR